MSQLAIDVQAALEAYQEELDAAEQRFRERLAQLGTYTRAAEKAPAELTCEKCEREFTRPNARAMHEKHCDGSGTQRVRPPRRETFLCDRCPADFPTRERLEAHRSTHPPVETPKYVGQGHALAQTGE